MNTLSRVIATASLLVVVSACGSGSADKDSGTSPDPTGTPASTGSPESGVVSVSLRQTGGLKPVNVTEVFSADAKPPKGYTAGDVLAVIDAAEAFTSSGAELTRMPSDTCCDKVSYVVTITLDDGTSQTYETLDGLDQPKTFDTLLGQLG